MNRKGFGLVLVSICMALIGSSFVKAEIANDKANPCANLGNPPTVGQCWDCFQSLLADCDKQNDEAARRNACYTGANNFFNWCLGRVGGAANPRGPRGQAPAIERGMGVVYDLAFVVPVDPANVSVYVRDIDGGQVRMQEVKSFVFKNGDGSVSVFFDDMNLGLEDDKVIGVVTAVKDLQGNIVGAYAEAFDLVTPGDLNGDDQVDGSDIVVAWEKYGNGDMSYEDFAAYLSRYAR